MPGAGYVVVFAVLIGATAPASAQFRDRNQQYPGGISSQGAATKSKNDGTIMAYDQIVKRVGPQVGGTLIASDYQRETYTYRLRYMRGGSVVIVDVDARSANIIRREGF